LGRNFDTGRNNFAFPDVCCEHCTFVHNLQFFGGEGGRGFPSLEHSGGICPHPMSHSFRCCRYADRATNGTCENHYFIYLFIFVHIWYIYELFQRLFNFKNEIRMEEILQNCNFDMCPCVTQLQFIVKRKITHSFRNFLFHY